MSATTTRIHDRALAEDVLRRIAADLSLIMDRDFTVDGVDAERSMRRPAGEGAIHISFKLGFQLDRLRLHGCLLVPLPDAIAIAGYLMMQPDDVVAAERRATSLDEGLKEALLEVGNFVAGATDAIVRAVLPRGLAVRPEGCQGVRADVRPALVYQEGDELVVARASARIHDFPTFELLLLLPILPGLDG